MNRKSLRLNGYDYSQEGYYFITICTYQKRKLFGEIVNGKIVLNDIGQIAWNAWQNSLLIRDNIELDEFIIMPNHVHGIVHIKHSTIQKETQGFQSPKQTIGSMVRGYKGKVTSQIKNKFNQPHIPIWHRNYYDHIIRNDSDLENIRNYIRHNPLKWSLDEMFVP